MEHVGNPVMVVDEVEKSGTATSMSGRAFGLSEALLPLLEPLTARSWSCPFYQVKFDMSWVIWVLTSNNYHALPEPLLSRCPPISLRALTTDELVMFIWREGRRQGTEVVPEEAELTGTTGAMKSYNVLPMAGADEVIWLDASGYELARSPDEFGLYDQSDLANDFVLNAGMQATVRRVFARSRRR